MAVADVPGRAGDDATTHAATHEVQTHFEEHAREYYAKHSGETGSGEDIKESYLRALAPVLATGPVLDVGCGPGNFAGWVRDRTQGGVVGVDFSLPMVQMARRLFPEVHCVVADARHLPFAPGTFQTTYSFRSLQHVPDMEAAVADMHRVTAEGGHLVFDFVNRWNPLGRARESLTGRRGLIYLKATTFGRITRLCRRLGLSVVSREPIQFLVDDANVEKHFGGSGRRWIGWLLRQGNRLGNVPGLRALSLRVLVVARKPERP